MVVYAAQLGPRLEYIAGYFLGELCGFTVRFTTNIQEIADAQGPAIVYHERKLAPRAIHIKPQGLLCEHGVSKQDPGMAHWEELTCIFPTEGDIPFDLFSAAFYLVSRYEEYLPSENDVFGRYAHTNSVAYQYRFLDIPLVDLWAQKFRKLAGGEIAKGRQFRFVPTYDIDIAWAFLHKGFLRNAGGLGRSLLSGDFAQAGKRLRVLRGVQQDPYDVYEWLDALHLRFGLKPYYFFLLAARNSEYDKHILPSKKALKDLVRYHAAGYRTGIHPSWQSRRNETLLKEEVSTLETLTKATVAHNRFHYLAFTLPGGYRKLRELGIRSDFSMGYGTINGFRASVSVPFPWYDLEKEEETELMVHPFCWMDANSYYEQQYTPAQAFAELKNYHDVVKKAGGQLMTISHNNFFSNEPGFAGWKEVYEIFLEEVVYWDL